MEWGSYYLGNVFEEWPGKVRRPWDGTSLLLLSTLTTDRDYIIGCNNYCQHRRGVGLDGGDESGSLNVDL